LLGSGPPSPLLGGEEPCPSGPPTVFSITLPNLFLSRKLGCFQDGSQKREEKYVSPVKIIYMDYSRADMRGAAYEAVFIY